MVKSKYTKKFYDLFCIDNYDLLLENRNVNTTQIIFKNIFFFVKNNRNTIIINLFIFYNIYGFDNKYYTYRQSNNW